MIPSHRSFLLASAPLGSVLLASAPLGSVLLASLLLAACSGESAGGGPESAYRSAERGPGRSPEPAELEYHWLQALDRSDVGDEVQLEIGAGPLEGRFELRLEDLYVELWHARASGAKGARRLLEGLRNCDPRAAIRFGQTLFVKAGELDPPSEWPLELRYLEGDAHGRQAAEFLRDHLRTSCDDAARELVREIVDRYGLVLRPVAAFPYAEDPGNRIPLVLVLSPPTAVAESSDP